MMEVGFCPAQELHDISAIFKVIGGNEFIKLGRLDAGACQHGMDLAAMVGLVVEQVEEKIIAPFNLQPCAAMYGNIMGKRFSREGITQA